MWYNQPWEISVRWLHLPGVRKGVGPMSTAEVVDLIEALLLLLTGITAAAGPAL